MKTQVSDAGCAALASALNGGALQALEDLDLARIPASPAYSILALLAPLRRLRYRRLRRAAASAAASSSLESSLESCRSSPPPPPNSPPGVFDWDAWFSAEIISQRRQGECLIAILATPTTKEACRLKTCQYSRHCKSIAPTRLGVDWRC